MRRNERRGVYETNSSSVHSLVISREGREESHLYQDKNGYIITDYGDFGKEHALYWDQASKLSYLVTLIYYGSGFDVDDVYDNYNFTLLEEAICEYTGAKGIKILGKEEPYIDHQSVPEYNDIDIVNMYSKDSIIDFVFNKYVALETDCD